jgi:uncharacterized protein DUF4238
MTSDPAPLSLRHIIPKHYLRGFADGPAHSHLWVYNKGQAYSTGNVLNRRNPFRQAIKTAGAERGAYSLVTLTGDRLDVDEIITKQEVWGVQVLQKLRARQPISVQDKVAFSLYLDLMRGRVPARDLNALQFVRRAMETFDWDLLARRAAAEGRFDLAQRFDPRVPENVAAVERELLLRGASERSEMIVKQIAMMRWLFFQAAGEEFFPTTDNPAFHPPGLGLAKEHGFMLMPIDSKLLLFVSNTAGLDRQYVTVAPSQYTLFRNVILAGATARAYACRNEPEVLEMLNNPRLLPPG